MFRPLILVGAALIFVGRLSAHEGHGIPGALPPAPHGGVVQEAIHEEEHAHKQDHKESSKEEHVRHTADESHEEEPELFFEAVYKNKELKIFPLVLPEGSNPMFKPLSPLKQFSEVSLRIEFPRAKTSQNLKAVVDSDAIRAPFDAKKVNRFIIHLTVKEKDEEKRVSIQLENG